MHKIKLLKYTGIVIIFFAVSSFTQQEDEKEKLYKEYQQITQRLQNVQEQALSDAKIAEQSENFSEKVDQEMIRQNPAVRPKIDRRNSIVDEFERARSTGNESEMYRLQQEFQVITQDLKTHQQKAMENEQLREEGEELEKALLEKMKEIDPEVPNLVARLETLGNQIQGQEL